MFVMFFNVVFAVFVCYSAAFCQLCFYNKDWIGLDWLPKQRPKKIAVFPQKSRTQLHTATYLIFTIQKLVRKQMLICYDLTTVS